MRTVILPDDTEVDVLTYSAAEALAAADKYWQRRQEPMVLEAPENSGLMHEPKPQARVAFQVPEDAKRWRVDLMDDGSVSLSVRDGFLPQPLNIRVVDGVAVIAALEDDDSPCLCDDAVLDV